MKNHPARKWLPLEGGALRNLGKIIVLLTKKNHIEGSTVTISEGHVFLRLGIGVRGEVLEPSPSKRT